MDVNGTENSAKLQDVAHEKWLSYVEQQRRIAADQENLLLEMIQGPVLKRDMYQLAYPESFVEKNNLAEQLKALEFDKWTLKGALTQLKQDSEYAIKELASIKNDQSLIVCLLDGDGAIFSPEYLKQGELGGRRAAEALANGLIGYVKSNSEVMPAGIKMMAFVFVSKSGLESILERSGFCSPEELSAFFRGFVQAHPLFDVIDVGTGKEKADHKLREHLDLFLRNPQTSKIFFGGSHDNGYTGNLAAAQTTGHIKKLVILRSYSQIAREIHNLQLPTLEIPGLFLANKLSHLLNGSTPSRQYSPLPTPFNQLENQPPYPPAESSKPPSSPKKHHAKPSRTFSSDMNGGKSNKKRHPAPCNFKYLGSGCTNKHCSYGHDYELSNEELEEMRTSALKAPCRYINDNKPCLNAKCHLGHRCPRGPTCDFHARGQCKFVGADMHT